MQEKAGTVLSESESREARKRREDQGRDCDASVLETCVGCCVRKRRRWSRCGEQSAFRDAGCERAEDRDMEGGNGRRGYNQERGYNTPRGREQIIQGYRRERWWRSEGHECRCRVRLDHGHGNREAGREWRVRRRGRRFRQVERRKRWACRGRRWGGGEGG